MERNYEDIIETDWKGCRGRPGMPMAQRAKIFLPFAALKGYEEALEEKRMLSVQEEEPRYSGEEEENSL